MHTSSSVTLAVAVFLASAVESVEAVTIIVAAGVSRGWRSALEGAAAALAVLVVLVGALGPALVYLVPISVLRTVVGALLLVFGLQWLRKAILRTVGLKAKHDEDAIFREQVEALTVAANGSASATGRRDWRRRGWRRRDWRRRGWRRQRQAGQSGTPRALPLPSKAPSSKAWRSPSSSSAWAPATTNWL